MCTIPSKLSAKNHLKKVPICECADIKINSGEVQHLKLVSLKWVNWTTIKYSEKNKYTWQ